MVRLPKNGSKSIAYNYLGRNAEIPCYFPVLERESADFGHNSMISRPNSDNSPVISRVLSSNSQRPKKGNGRNEFCIPQLHDSCRETNRHRCELTMGRVRRKTAQTRANFGRRFPASRQDGGSNLDPVRLLLVALAACLFLVGTAFTQTSPDSAASTSSFPQFGHSTSDSEPPVLDSKINVANPFATPWLLHGPRR